MRHWRLGYPLEGFAPVAGRPCRYWFTLFILTHRRAGARWERTEWPDGRPLLAQPWPQARILWCIADELEAAAQQEGGTSP